MNNPYAPSDFAANNPFALDPQSRYPAINGSPAQDPSATQFTQWLQPGAQSPMGMPGQQQQVPYQQQPQLQQQIPQQFSPGYIPQQGYAAPQSPSQFQPSSSFGQQLAGQVNGSSYGYLQGQNTAQSPGGYNPVQQQLQNNPGYIAQFDPYSSIGQGWDGSQPQQQQQQQQQQMQSPAMTPGPTSPGGALPFTTSATGQVHPREYIRTHKAEVESWDTYAWKQLLNGFDALKEAWEARKKEIEGHVSQLQRQMQQQMQQYNGALYAAQIQQEASRLQGMAKDAESNFDSVAASSFQMHEVFANYRQSADLASKRRVREASNAALTSLPDWPPLAY
ncbi:hypothetical protein B0H16DRAFT_1304448 [Mycena metata]|uniref:Uncharacterized protein n=1 Tax=Mycena metata TaxID=1033252 RepID=A0AAD7JW88_9AGAR|nr:hypothetical protein B0H16DRAFT_1304448 [Mycena metata]